MIDIITFLLKGAICTAYNNNKKIKEIPTYLPSNYSSNSIYEKEINMFTKLIQSFGYALNINDIFVKGETLNYTAQEITMSYHLHSFYIVIDAHSVPADNMNGNSIRTQIMSLHNISQDIFVNINADDTDSIYFSVAVPLKLANDKSVMNNILGRINSVINMN